MNEELLALYTADREERIDQPRMGTPEYTAMRERDRQRRLRAAAILSTLPIFRSAGFAAASTAKEKVARDVVPRAPDFAT